MSNIIHAVYLCDCQNWIVVFDFNEVCHLIDKFDLFSLTLHPVPIYIYGPGPLPVRGSHIIAALKGLKLHSIVSGCRYISHECTCLTNQWTLFKALDQAGLFLDTLIGANYKHCLRSLTSQMEDTESGTLFYTIEPIVQ